MGIQVDDCVSRVVFIYVPTVQAKTAVSSMELNEEESISSSTRISHHSSMFYMVGIFYVMMTKKINLDEWDFTLLQCDVESCMQGPNVVFECDDIKRCYK